MIAEPAEHEHHDAGGEGIADATAHRLPARMADVDGVDEGVAHQAADERDDAVGGEHAGGGEVVARGLGALDVVERLDQIVDAEGDRGDQDHAEVFEAREDMVDRRNRQGEAEVAEGR